MTLEATPSSVQTLFDACHDTPPSGSLPVKLRGCTVGVLTPLVQSLLHPHLLETWGWSLTSQALTYSGSLQALSSSWLSLHEAIGTMPSLEWLDVTAHEGSQHVLTQAPRSLFRRLGLTTHCVRLVGYQGDRLILGQRSSQKRIAPGLWDTLSGGLVQAGESPLEALIRETQEEAGLEPNDYILFGKPRAMTLTRQLPEGWMREICWVFEGRLQPNVSPHNRDGEVARFLAMPSEEIVRLWDSHALMPEAALALFSRTH